MWVGGACPVSAETSLSDTAPQGLSSADSYDTLPKKTSELRHVERIIYILRGKDHPESHFSRTKSAGQSRLQELCKSKSVGLTHSSDSTQ